MQHSPKEYGKLAKSWGVPNEDHGAQVDLKSDPAVRQLRPSAEKRSASSRELFKISHDFFKDFKF